MTHRVIYHAGTETIIGFDDGTYIIDIPDEIQELEEMEEFCKQDMVVKSVSVIMPYCDGTLKEQPNDG